MSKTVVIGLDGSTWDLINRWTDTGNLPLISDLKDSGTSAVSSSYLPPVTCPNWKCYSTGKGPGKLGVYWWERIDTTDRSIHLPNSTDFVSPELWDYLNDGGYRTGVMNLPMTYPPRQLEGFMVSGGPRSRERNYTEPAELERELVARFDYRVHPENVLTSNNGSNDEVEMAYDLLRTRLRTARTLIDERDIDLLHVTLFHLNVLHHYFWDGPETRRAYEIIDEELKAFVDSGYNLVIMSDHGCTRIDTVFYINRWLEENGYLATKTSIASRLHDIGVTQERIASAVRSIGLEKYIRPLVPRHIIERFPSDEGIVREEKLKMVDWEHTCAIGSGQGLVYVVADDPNERESILDDLHHDLARTTGPNNEPIASAVHRREDLYKGDYVHLAPDIVFDQRPGVHTSEAMGRAEVFTDPTNWRAENIPEGLALFYGEDIRAQHLETIRISDIAPTILHWMGVDVPDDMDGEVLTDIFDRSSEPGMREVSYRKPLHEREVSGRSLDEDVQERLQQIGYLE